MINFSNIQTIGNKKILNDLKLAVFCSKICPPEIIVKSLDLAVKLRNNEITVISGFQTVVEKEFLEILLKGDQNIIWAHSRNVKDLNRIPKKIKVEIEKGKFLIISDFPENENRPSEQRGLKRNYFVAEIADTILILHASPNSNIEELALSYYNSDKKIYTIQSKNNSFLINLGFKDIETSKIIYSEL